MGGRLKNFLLIMFLILNDWGVAKAQVRSVSIEWEKVSAAKMYEIMLIDQNGQAQNFESSTTSWSGPLAPGQYRFKIRGKDLRGYAGPWTTEESLLVKVMPVLILTPEPNAELVGDSDIRDIDFSWTASSANSTYHFQIQDDSGNVILQKSLKENSLSLKINMGIRYKWSVQVEQDNQLSDPVLTHLTLLSTTKTKPKLKKPKNKFVREVQWEKDAYPDSVDLVVYRFDETAGEFRIFQESKSYKESTFIFPVEWPGGRYKVSAVARKEGKIVSSKDEIEFEVQSGDRSEVAEKKYYVQSFLNRTAGQFMHLNYIMSQVDYSSASLEFGSTTSFSALTGTLEAGYGGLFFLDWGYRANLGVGGILVDKKNYLLKELDVQVFKKIRLTDLSEMRAWLGIDYHELIEAHKSLVGSDASVGVNSIIGAQIGGDIWYAFSSNWGIKGNFEYTQHMIGTDRMKAGVDSGHSMRLGAFLTYNYSPETQLHMGYSFGSEVVQYKSTGSYSEGSKIEIEGKYLNLRWEMGF